MSGARSRSTYHTAGELDFVLADVPRLAGPDRVLLADPRDFDVKYAINPHMRDERGELHRVDRDRAREQWDALRDAFTRLGVTVHVAAPLTGHPDLAFCANQVLPLPPGVGGDDWGLVPSNMARAERRGEVAHVVESLAALGLRVDPSVAAGPFEGTGDGLWHPGRRLLWAGVGPRSVTAAWREIAERYRVPTLVLALRDADFYHLDTCLALLDERTALWVPSAFDEPSRELVRACIERLIEVDETEARTRLACNAYSPDGLHVLIQSGSAKTHRALAVAGYRVVELETSEFLKSGGSAFCLKLAFGISDARRK